MVECAKDKVWGTGLVLSRDDWYDTTLWDSPGILGEMLTEIRDTYLSKHPNLDVQPLVYGNKSTQVRKHSSNFTVSHPADNSLPRSRSNPDISGLRGVPSPLETRSITETMSDTSSQPNLLLVNQQTPLHPFQAVPMEQSTQSVFRVEKAASSDIRPVSGIQSTLISLSQTDTTVQVGASGQDNAEPFAHTPRSLPARECINTRSTIGAVGPQANSLWKTAKTYTALIIM